MPGLPATPARRGIGGVPLHTSDGAIASFVLALLGSFTILGTALAVLVGIYSLVRIRRHRDRLVGTGYAVFGVVWGLAFTGLSLFAYSTGEFFGLTEQIRKQQYVGELEDPPDLTIVREKDGFSITRPTHAWEVAKSSLQQRLSNRTDLLLVNAGKDAFLDVQVDHRARLVSLDEYQKLLLESFQNEQGVGRLNRGNGLQQVSGCKVLDRRVLPGQAGQEQGEMVIEVKVLNQPLLFLVRTVKEATGTVFVLRAWAMRRRFTREEKELRELVDSFRSLDHP